MFTINTCFKECQKLSRDWFIIVNGHKCLCNKAVANKISPIIQEFNKNKKNEGFIFATEILDNQTLSDTSNLSENSIRSLSSLNSICIMISKLFCGEEIICQEDNLEILNLIGKHFKVQEIINKIKEYQRYFKMVTSHLKNNTDFKVMIELEKMLLFEINEANIEAKVKEYESLIKKIPIRCFINFVINICTKKYNINKIDTNVFIIKIIKNVDNIIPRAFPRFLSILFHKFINLNSTKLINAIDKFSKKEINSLIHQIFAFGLMKNIIKNIKFNQNEIIIPEDLQQYFKKEGSFFELAKIDITLNRIKEEKTQFFYIIELIKNDIISSFQDYLASSQIDINCNIKNNITNRISYIDDDEECSLIELSAFFGSIKCFTYLFNKNADMKKSRLGNFAVAGGNPEIIHICEREDCVFNDKTLDISIEYHKHQITKWLVDTKNIRINEKNLRNSIIFYNIKTIKYLIKKGININKMMIYICESNNIILFKWLEVLLKNYEMKMIYQENNKTLLHVACEQNNVEIVKLLISREYSDPNSIYEAFFDIQNYLLCY